MKNWRAGDGIWIHVQDKDAWPEEARGPAWALRRQEVKILGIESASLVASVAIVDGDIVVAEYTVDYKKTHSQTLLPMLDEIVRMTEQDLKTVDAIAVSGGPGSFTGLRIGAATAKGLAWPWTSR